jgi:cytochrome b subunit of formate dehydrogenase
MFGITKGKLLKFINPILFLVMLIQLTSGLGQRYASQDIFIFFRRVHVFNSRLVILFFIIHLYLNWAWIKGWIMTNLVRSRPS